MRKLISRARAMTASSALFLLSVLVAACSTDGVMAVRPDVDIGTQTAGVPANVDLMPQASPTFVEPDGQTDAMSVPDMDARPRMSGPELDSEPQVQTAAMPRAEVETLEPSGPRMTAYPRMDERAPDIEAPEGRPASIPSDEIACRKELKKLGVTYSDLPAIHGGGSCQIDYPVKVSAIGNVKMQPAATLSCDMAATFSRWTKKELVPTARSKYWSGVKTIHQGSSYSCRNIRGTRGTPSQHSIGNALDIMRIELNNGKDIDVRKPGWFSFRQRGFLNTVRADGCEYFTTVLGPGYNADHANHFHFDIMKRRNGHVACK